VILSDLQRGTTRTDTIRNMKMSWPREVVVAASVSVVVVVRVSGMMVKASVVDEVRKWGMVERNSLVA